MTTITVPDTIPTTTATILTTAPPTKTAVPRVSLARVVRAEAVKLRSVRSNTLTIVATSAALLIVGLISAAITGGLVADPGGPEEAAANAAAGAPLSGTLIAQLIIGVLGVMAITSEYATGLIRTTLTAVPARLPVLWATAAVVIAATLPAMLVTLFATFVAGQALIGTGDIATASLGDDGVLRAVFGTGAYLTGVALIGLAIGTVLRGTAAGISVLFGLVFLLPGLGGLLLPASWRANVLQFLPSEAGSAFCSVTPNPELLASGTGALVFLAWVLVPLAVAAVVLKRRSV